MKRASWFYPALLFVVGFILHAWIIMRWPIIFGGDTILRMANRDHVLLSYQLPALQAGLHLLARISESAVLARYFMALIGSIAGVGFYFFGGHFMDRTRAFVAGLLFASNPYLLAISTVPFQEILMLAGLFFAFHFFFSDKLGAASASLALACFTRYEAWAACPVLALAFAQQRNWRPAAIVKAGLLFGWAPIGWILYSRGMSPGGTFVLDSGITAWRLMRYVYLGWITVKNTPIPVLVLAAIGFITVWKNRTWKQPRMIILTAFVLLFLISIFFSAHGVSPDPERFVTEREAHLLIVGAVFVAAFGLSQLNRVTLALAVTGFALGVYGAGRIAARQTSQANLQLSYILANYFDSTLRNNERAIILVKPIPKELLQGYLDKVFQKGGPQGLANAQRVLRSIDTSPPDYQRTAVHSRLGKHRLLSFGGIAASDLNEWEWLRSGAEWIAIWSDFQPGNASEQRIYEIATRNGNPIRTLLSGPLSVSIYHTGLRTPELTRAPAPAPPSARPLHKTAFR